MSRALRCGVGNFPERVHRVLLALSLVTGLGSPAEADDGPDHNSTAASPRIAHSSFWATVASQDGGRARMLLGQARRLVAVAALEPGAGRLSRAYLEGARRRLELAEALSPLDAEVLLEFARVITRLSDNDQSLADVAEERWRRLRALDSDLEAETVAFELAVLLTRSQRYSDAALEYNRALDAQLTTNGSSRGVIYGNLAEVTMLAGDLEGALRSYRRAHRLAAGPVQYALTLWGEAIVLDRLDDHPRALAVARRALATPLGADALEESGVFFEPRYEVHWYQALAHEARAGGFRDSQPSEARRDALEAAARSWARFLDSGGRLGSRWAGIAQTRLERVRARLRSTAGAAGSAPRWLRRRRGHGR